MSSYLIVGAGVFGLSTAYYLLLEGEKSVTIIDQSPVLPAPDAASNDLNRVVRSSYSDPIYAQLGKEAIDLWKRDFPGIYRESGLIILGDPDYISASQANDIRLGASTTPINDNETLAEVISSSIPIGSVLDTSTVAYHTPSGGWADAGTATTSLLHKVRELGGVVRGGVKVVSLELDDNQGLVLGVNTDTGETLKATTVILATGSWTPSTFSEPALGLTNRLVATGQSLGYIQLTETERQRYQDVPVVKNHKNGFYTFPPTSDGLVKAAIDGAGYLHLADTSKTGGISSPRTISTHGQAGLFIPADMAQRLREGLKSLYPELDRPLCKTRLCWYTETEDKDFLIDFHPEYKNLVFATGGSGHAFKFLPLLGRLVVKRLRGALSSDMTAKFAFKPDSMGAKKFYNLPILDATHLVSA